MKQSRITTLCQTSQFLAEYLLLEKMDKVSYLASQFLAGYLPTRKHPSNDRGTNTLNSLPDTCALDDVALEVAKTITLNSLPDT